MGRIVVLTDDRVFGRMLELELIYAGHEVIFDRGMGNTRERDGAVQVNSSDERRARRDHVRASGELSGTSFSNDSDAFSADADVLIFDADTRDIEHSGLDFAHKVAIISDADRLDEFSEFAGCLVRPFETSLLLGLISELVSNTDKTAETTALCPSEYIDIDMDNSRASFRGNRLDLTRREFDLLACLYALRGTPVSRSELIRRVWRYDFEGNTNVVDVYIRYLREKIDIPFGVKLIETVRGAGYRMV